ncbi:MAG: ACP S-malonyltransferase [Candidatus Krumholzibacteria bacterium]|nr:ACP S-malonyltransferase [Candidatus Krumholzibacteria bacterium]
MMNCAMLFPGQASQFVGMGKDYYDRFKDVRGLYASANRKLGFDITQLSFEGDLDELTKTHNAQPAILLHSLAVFSVLTTRGFKAKVVAGHSLGEFSALVAAGVFRPMDALLIVRKRGELMYEAGLEQPGTMAALIGLDEAAVRDVVQSASETGVIVVANYNSPAQVAVSGEVAAVERAIELAKLKGAKRALRLQVSGAFHSPLMERTAAALESYMSRFERGRLRVGWIANVTGSTVEGDHEVIDLLSRQLSSPVLWVKSMRTLADSYSDPILEVGPGKVLTGLMKRIVSNSTVYPLSNVDGLQNVVTPG